MNFKEVEKRALQKTMTFQSSNEKTIQSELLTMHIIFFLSTVDYKLFNKIIFVRILEMKETKNMAY